MTLPSLILLSAAASARDAPVLVLTTIGAGADATVLARVLVEERLAACVSTLAPMTSVYRWEGQIEQAAEQQLVMKTVVGRVEALRARLRDLHPYDVPEFLVIPVAGGGADYLAWLRESVG